MNCPLCQSEINEPVVGGPDVQCGGCQRTWYATGNPEYPIMGRTMRVKLTKMPEEGDRYADVVQPRPAPNRDAIIAAVDSLKSAMFHLRQSGLDDEWKLGRAQVEATLLNLERRLAEMRRLLPPVADNFLFLGDGGKSSQQEEEAVGAGSKENNEW